MTGVEENKCDNKCKKKSLAFRYVTYKWDTEIFIFESKKMSTFIL